MDRGRVCVKVVTSLGPPTAVTLDELERMDPPERQTTIRLSPRTWKILMTLRKRALEGL